MTTKNAQHALVWLLTVHSAARTGSRTHHRNPGLDIRAIFEEGRENAKLVDCQSSPCVGLSTTLGKGMKPTPGEVFAGARWGWVMNELTPRGHLRPLGGRENPRRARPESRSPRRCAHARGAPYSPRAAPSILTKGEPTGTRAQVPSRSCTCAKALTETHPGVRMADGDWKSH